MASNIIQARIQLRQGNNEYCNSFDGENKKLLKGEPIFNTETNILKIGDGSDKSYEELPSYYLGIGIENIQYVNGILTIEKSDKTSIEKNIWNFGNQDIRVKEKNILEEIYNTYPTETQEIQEMLSTDIGAKEIPVKSLSVAVSLSSPSNSILIRNTGKNLCGGRSLADGIKTAIKSATLSTESKTIVWEASAKTEGDNSFTGDYIQFKPNVRYSFVIAYSNSSTSSAEYTNMYVLYTDDTTDGITFSGATAGQKNTGVFVTRANRTVAKIGKSNQGGKTTLYYEESGIFEGVLTKSDFKPFEVKEIAVTRDSGTMQSGTLTFGGGTAWTYNDGTDDYPASASSELVTRLGVNNIRTPAGTVSATYRLDPTLAYEKLKNTIATT